MNPWPLDYWSTGEWQVVSERLQDLSQDKTLWNPGRGNLFTALKLIKPDDVRVLVVGQDPYPRPEHATGVAFSIPSTVPREKYPPTLRNIFKEYCHDLGYPEPSSGDLSDWCKRGVLLWNAYPSCEAFKPSSHHWLEWGFLTREIVEMCDKQNIVLVFLGGIARRFRPRKPRSVVISTSHPSPLGASSGFLGSRIFTTINMHLSQGGLDLIDWRLT